MQRWHLNCFTKTMLQSRQSLPNASQISALHEAIALIQCALGGLASPTSAKAQWRGRSLFGIESLCREEHSIAQLFVNGIATAPVTLSHAHPRDNRRRLLFAINGIQAETGVRAFPETGSGEQARIRLQDDTGRPAHFQSVTNDPTVYRSMTQRPLLTVLGGVVILADALAGTRSTPIQKGIRLQVSSAESVEVCMPCQAPTEMSAQQLQQWMLALRVKLMELGGRLARR
jgi:hypothetical protein